MKIEECSPLISYDPVDVWEGFNTNQESWYSQGTYISSWHPGSTASFSFNGTGFTIFGLQSNTSGDFIVSIDGQNHTGTANTTETTYLAPLFNSSILSNSMHDVKFIIGEGWRPVNLDFIELFMDSGSSRNSSLISNGGGDDGDRKNNDDGNDSDAGDDDGEPNPPTMEHKMYQDSDLHFEYLPQEAWNTDPAHVNAFKNQSGHSTSMANASLTFTFTGEGITLFGSIGPTQSSSYSVSLDGGPAIWFNASMSWWSCDEVLYHASNLGQGEHKLVVTNGFPGGGGGGRGPPGPGQSIQGRQQVGGGDDPSQTGTGTIGSFDFDYAMVQGANLAVTSTQTSSTSPTSTSPSDPSTSTSLPSTRKLPAGAIAGITVASVVFVFLLLGIWFLNKRNKTLWMRLQKGYIVQSQFDSSNSNSNTNSPRPNMSTTRLLPLGSVDPYPPGYEGASHARQGSDQNGLYVPYTGFGRQRSTSKGSSQTYDVSDNEQGKGGYQHQAKPSQMDSSYDPYDYGGGRNGYNMRSTEPARSGTLLSASTLVAEAGTDGTLNDDGEGGCAGKVQRWNTLRRVGTPTNSTASLVPTFGSAQRPGETDNVLSRKHRTSTRSSTRSSRRLTARMSRNSQSIMHIRRSSSPSHDHLLSDPANNAFHDVNLNEEEEYDISEEDADFYAQEASASYESRSLSGSPTRSVAITQSEIQTPVANRLFSDFHDEHIPPVPLVSRQDSTVVGPANSRFERNNYDPQHQSSADTYSTLPPYSSKRTSLL